MRAGQTVRRQAEIGIREQVADDITYCGTEPPRLMNAWTDAEKPAQVFMGAWSNVLFVPGDEERNATDWVIVDQRRGT